MRPNCLELVIRGPGAEPHLDRARENAEKRRREKRGAPLRGTVSLSLGLVL